MSDPLQFIKGKSLTLRHIFLLNIFSENKNRAYGKLMVIIYELAGVFTFTTDNRVNSVPLKILTRLMSLALFH